jgi:hypothetical protein
MCNRDNTDGLNSDNLSKCQTLLFERTYCSRNQQNKIGLRRFLEGVS